jgi:hypothetical protein
VQTLLKKIIAVEIINPSNIVGKTAILKHVSKSVVANDIYITDIRHKQYDYSIRMASCEATLDMKLPADKLYVFKQARSRLQAMAYLIFSDIGDAIDIYGFIDKFIYE